MRDDDRPATDQAKTTPGALHEARNFFSELISGSTPVGFPLSRGLFHAASPAVPDKGRDGPSIGFQALINPVIDMTSGGTLEPQSENRDIVRRHASMSVSDPEDVNDPYVSPFLAEDHRDLPPALVVIAEHDGLRDEKRRDAEQLHEAGVPANVYCQFGVGHLAGDGTQASRLAQESLDVVVAALRGACGRDAE